MADRSRVELAYEAELVKQRDEARAALAAIHEEARTPGAEALDTLTRVRALRSDYDLRCRQLGEVGGALAAAEKKANEYAAIAHRASQDCDVLKAALAAERERAERFARELLEQAEAHIAQRHRADQAVASRDALADDEHAAVERAEVAEGELLALRNVHQRVRDEWHAERARWTARLEVAERALAEASGAEALADDFVRVCGDAAQLKRALAVAQRAMDLARAFVANPGSAVSRGEVLAAIDRALAPAPPAEEKS